MTAGTDAREDSRKSEPITAGGRPAQRDRSTMRRDDERKRSGREGEERGLKGHVCCLLMSGSERG